jgi:hypothetical protein
VYCCNIPGLIQKLSVENKVNERRLYVDSSKRSLKAVLLHNFNNYAQLPIGHSVHLKESYDNFELVLTVIGYTANDWIICGYLKVLCMLLGQQAGYTKYPCLMCEWDSRERNQNWEQEYFVQTSCLSVENTAATPSY